MGKPGKIDISETIGGRNAENTTRGIRGTNKVHITDVRGPSIYGFHRRIRERMRRSVDERYRGSGYHCVEKRMDP